MRGQSLVDDDVDSKETDSLLNPAQPADIWKGASVENREDMPFVKRIFHTFDNKFLIHLMCSYIGVKGFVLNMVGIGQVPFYKDFMGLNSTRYQSLKTVANTPWATKSIIGAMSDAVPFFGYHKRSYILLFGTFGIGALITVATLPKSSPPEVAAMCFFLINLFVATLDLLTEGKYAEIMMGRPDTGSELVSWVWALTSFGGLIGACLAGPLAESGHIQLIFWICLPMALQSFAPVLLGWLPEAEKTANSSDDHTKAEAVSKYQQQPKLFWLAGFVSTGAIILAIVGEVASPLGQLIAAVIISTLACVFAHWVLPPVLAKANLYMFLAQALYLDVSGASTYFYIAKKHQYPDGPHFTPTYYFTITAVVGAFASIIGVVLFQALLSKGRFRVALWTTTFLGCVASFVDVVIINRWNLDIGIPDKIWYMLGDAMILPTIATMNYMPMAVLTSKVCPRGFEALVFALLAGFQNFGQTTSSFIGVYAASCTPIQTNADELPWSFEGLGWLVLGGHCLLPLVCVPLTWVLIPPGKLTDDLSHFVESIASPRRPDRDSSQPLA